MDRAKNRSGKRQWNNNKRGPDMREKKAPISPDEIANQEAIKAHKLKTYICPMCQQPVTELSTSLADKSTGEPVHFDCVINYLQEKENLLPDQKIVYIGQGRFGVVVFPNPHDMRNFDIIRIIEWEERDKKAEWRTEIADLYSHVK